MDGVASRSLRQYRQFYLVYPEIWQTPSAKTIERLIPTSIWRTLSAKSQTSPPIQNQPTIQAIELIQKLSFTGKTICVMDTKYKRPETPSSEDVAQIVTYAEMKNCEKGILVYPAPQSIPLTEYVGKIRVRSMTFSLAGDLEQAGRAFLDQLLLVL